MSRLDTELTRIRKVLQNNFKGIPGRAEQIEEMIRRDVERGDAEIIIGGFIVPEEGGPPPEKVAEENRKKERIFFRVKTLPLPQNRSSVKVIFQTMEDTENQELLHLLHKRTRT